MEKSSILDCRQRIVKQCVPKPVDKRGKEPIEPPGPADYRPPEIIGGPGIIGKIRRAPAYSFGVKTPLPDWKPPLTVKAGLPNVSGMTRKGIEKIPQGPMGILCARLDKNVTPGPGAYSPKYQLKSPPAYSVRPSAPGYKAPWDMWTPGPNMYCPPIPAKRMPAYTFGLPCKVLKDPRADFPGPGEHDPKFKYVEKTKPAAEFGNTWRRHRIPDTPAPNAYCEKKYKLFKKSSPAPSFGIRHTPYLGEQAQYLKPSTLDVRNSN